MTIATYFAAMLVFYLERKGNPNYELKLKVQEALDSQPSKFLINLDYNEFAFIKDMNMIALIEFLNKETAQEIDTSNVH